MAIQKGIIRLSGKIGSLVFFEKDGQGMVKTAADKTTYKLSEDSKKTSVEFRTANMAASLFRNAFKPILVHTSDKKFIHRLKSQLIKIINTGPAEKKGDRQVTDGDAALLKNLEFNCYTSLDNLIAFSPVIETDPFDKLRITIPKLLPARDFKISSRATKVVIQFSCCSFDYAGENGRFVQPDDLVISLTAESFPGGTLDIPLEHTDDRLLVLVMGVTFISNTGHTICDRKWYAGKVVESVLIKDGQIVTFQYPKPVITPALQDNENKRIGWTLNE